MQAVKEQEPLLDEQDNQVGWSMQNSRQVSFSLLGNPFILDWAGLCDQGRKNHRVVSYSKVCYLITV